MRTIATILSAAAVIAMAAGCASTVRKAGGYMDDPQTHYNEGMKYYNDARFADADKEFNLALSLDKKFAPAYAGLALAAAERKDFKTAYAMADKAEKYNGKLPQAYIARGVVITREKAGSKEEDWYEDAIKQFDKALKLDPKNGEALYRKGCTYKVAYLFKEAGDAFSKVLNLNNGYTKEADEQWKIVQDIERAAPGSRVGKKIALVEKISRADICALFVSELNVDKLLQKKTAKTYDTGFKAPPDQRELTTSTVVKTPAVTDMKGHWAENFVNDILAQQVRGLDAYPDHTFKPDQLVTRSEYAFMLEDILIAILGDQSLATKYVGSSPSRFPDVSASSPYYNAICNMVDKGIMKAKMSGEFGIEDPVSGAEALLVIRQLKELKK
jgi:tetratricopeptide (TPR) repeat protein